MHILSIRQRGRPKLARDRGQPELLARHLAVQEYILCRGGTPTHAAFESTPHLLSTIELLCPEALEKILRIDSLQGILRPRSHLVSSYRERIAHSTRSAWEDTDSGSRFHRVQQEWRCLLAPLTARQKKTLDKLLVLSPMDFIQHPLNNQDIQSLDRVLGPERTYGR